jgi:hypothetical protein
MSRDPTRRHFLDGMNKRLMRVASPSVILVAVCVAGCGQGATTTSSPQSASRKVAAPAFVTPRTCHELVTVAQVEKAVGRPIVASPTLPCEYQSHGNNENDVQLTVSFNREVGPKTANNSASCPPLGSVSGCYAPYSDTQQEQVRWRGQSLEVTLLGPQDPTALSHLAATLFHAMDREVQRASRLPLAAGSTGSQADTAAKRRLHALLTRLMTCARAKQREIPNEQLNNALSECPSELSENSRLTVEGGDVGPTVLKGVSPSGTHFALSIAEDGTVQTSCAPTGRGGCPDSGSW